MRARWVTLVAVILTASSATAQEARMPRVELGGNISGFLPIYFPDGPIVLVGAGPRVGLNLSRKIGLQVYVDALGPTEVSGTNGLYAADVKIPLRRSRGGQRTLSLTAGVTAPFHYSHVPERRVKRPDGSIVVQEAFRRFRAEAPATLIAGVARDHAFSRYTSANFMLQALVGPIGGVAVRAAMGVTFGPGGYR